MDRFPKTEKFCYEIHLITKQMEIEKYVACGLVYNALDLSLIKTEDVLKYLLASPVTDAGLIAYRHLLLKVPGDQHFCDNCHFLTKADPQYSAIYAMSNASPIIKPYPDSQYVDAGVFYYKGVLLLQQEPNLLRKIQIITDQTTIRLHLGDFELVVRARSEKLLGSITNHFSHYIFDLAKDVDWFEKIEKYYNTPGNLTPLLVVYQQRSTSLPEYWQKISARCEQLIKRMFSEGKFLPDRELPSKIKALFPSFFPPVTEGFDEKAWFIYQLPSNIQGYILGYPIHEKTPSHEELIRALQTLSTIGYQAYADGYEERHKARFNSSSATSLGFPAVPVIHVNEFDTLQESVYAYSSFDTIAVDVGNKRYFFTRPEFSNLVQKGKNHWTNLNLSYEDLALISIREILAQIFCLPSPVPMKELLKNIETYVPTLSRNGQVYLQDPSKVAEEATINTETNRLQEFLGPFIYGDTFYTSFIYPNYLYNQ